MYDWIAAVAGIVILAVIASCWVVVWFGGALAEVRERRGWTPSANPSPPPAHSNCRCTVAPITPGLTIRRGGSVSWVEDAAGNVVWPESPVAEAEQIARDGA